MSAGSGNAALPELERRPHFSTNWWSGSVPPGGVRGGDDLRDLFEKRATAGRPAGSAHRRPRRGTAIATRSRNSDISRSSWNIRPSLRCRVFSATAGISKDTCSCPSVCAISRSTTLRPRTLGRHRTRSSRRPAVRRQPVAQPCRRRRRLEREVLGKGDVSGRKDGGDGRNRTSDKGAADLYITTWLRRRPGGGKAGVVNTLRTVDLGNHRTSGESISQTEIHHREH